MWKKSAIILMLILNLILISCGNNGEAIMGEEKYASVRIEQIVMAIENHDKEKLQFLFSSEAAIETDNLESQIDDLFKFMDGKIVSWKMDGWSSDEQTESGKKSLMVRPHFSIITDVGEFELFLIDYYIDTINPNNEGLYMLEISKSTYDGEWESWQSRMTAGISIIQ